MSIEQLLGEGERNNQFAGYKLRQLAAQQADFFIPLCQKRGEKIWQATDRFPEAKFIVMDTGYKTPRIAKKTLEDSRIPILPYTQYKGKKEMYTFL